VVWVGLRTLMRLSEEAEMLKGQCRLTWVVWWVPKKWGTRRGARLRVPSPLGEAVLVAEL